MKRSAWARLPTFPTTTTATFSRPFARLIPRNFSRGATSMTRGHRPTRMDSLHVLEPINAGGDPSRFLCNLGRNRKHTRAPIEISLYVSRIARNRRTRIAVVTSQRFSRVMGAGRATGSAS